MRRGPIIKCIFATCFFKLYHYEQTKKIKIDFVNGISF